MIMFYRTDVQKNNLFNVQIFCNIRNVWFKNKNQFNAPFFDSFINKNKKTKLILNFERYCTLSL